MTDTPALVLDEETRAHLARQPRALAARLLLCDQTDRGGPAQRGPLLVVGVHWTIEQAQTAYLVWVCYIAARRPGRMLSGRPTHEAVETLAGKLTGAAARSADFRELQQELTGPSGLNLPAGAVRVEDLLDWLAFCGTDPDRRRWRRYVGRGGVEESLSAARVLIDAGWLWQTHGKPEEAPAAPPPSVPPEIDEAAAVDVRDVHPDDPPTDPTPAPAPQAPPPQPGLFA